MPALKGVLETALYVDDLDRARGFYERILGLSPMVANDRLCAYDVDGRNVLLIFRRGMSLTTQEIPGGTIPPHDGAGPVHFAFAVATEDLAVWEQQLLRHGVAIEGRTDWPRGGHSIYFRDPDKHLVEFATPGIWPIY